MINTLGVELKRRPKPVASPDTKNIILELVGPSGIGKSTLHSKMRNVLHYRWNMQYMPSNGLNHDPDAGLDEFYKKCVSLAATALYNHNSFTRYASILRFLTLRAEEDHYLKMSGLLDSGGWFLDEGFTHYFTLQIIKIIETNAIKDEVLEKYFAGRRFVFLNAPTDYVIENLRERRSKIKGANPNDLLSVYSEDHIKRHIQKSLDNLHKLLELSTSFGARFWEIKITERNNEALNFIKSIEPDIIKTNNELEAKHKTTTHGRTL